MRTKATVSRQPSAVSNRQTANGNRQSTAFSLIEVLVAVTLLAVIVLGLMAMFDQTQRAFKLGMSQTDILESGRIATDMLARELREATPAYQPLDSVPNFFLERKNTTKQALVGTPAQRTNIMDDVFFLTRDNQTWTGIGYFVRTNSTTNPGQPGGVGIVGTLFRFETNASIVQLERSQNGMPGGLGGFFAGFDRARSGVPSAGVSKILDGDGFPPAGV